SLYFDGRLGDGQAYLVVFAHDLWIPLGGVERFELGVEINLFQLIHQDHRRVPIAGDIARRHRDTQTFVGSVAELFHDRAGLRAVRLDIRVISGQRLQHVGRHSPEPARRRLHRHTDLTLARVHYVDKRLAVEAQ